MDGGNSVFDGGNDVTDVGEGVISGVDGSSLGRYRKDGKQCMTLHMAWHAMA